MELKRDARSLVGEIRLWLDGVKINKAMLSCRIIAISDHVDRLKRPPLPYKSHLNTWIERDGISI